LRSNQRNYRLKRPTTADSDAPSAAPDQAPAIQPRLESADYQSLGDFRRAIRDFLAFSESSAREQGVTAQQHQALLAIRAHVGSEPMSIGELADCLLIKNHSAVGLVARLVERGLVRRCASQADRRRVLLTLEPRGEDVLERISQNNLSKLAGSARSLRRMLAMLKKLETAQNARGDADES
jgi:DNA-binding MarR family transcriptional regulator